jgi:hypothetical protein
MSNSQGVYACAFVATADDPGQPPVERFWPVGIGKCRKIFGDLRLSQYTYPDDPRRKSYNRTGSATMAATNCTCGYLLPNVEAIGHPAAMKKATSGHRDFGRHPLTDRYSISAGLDTTAQRGCHDSYNYWNLTLTATPAL